MNHHPDRPSFSTTHARRQRINAMKLKLQQRQRLNEDIDQLARHHYALREQERAKQEQKHKDLTAAQRRFVRRSPTKTRYSKRTGRPSSLHGGLAARIRGDTPRGKKRAGRRGYNNVYRQEPDGVSQHFALQGKQLTNRERIAIQRNKA